MKDFILPIKYPLFLVNSLLLLLFSGCREQEMYDPNFDVPHTKLEFSTINKTNVAISYENTGVEAPIYFEIYDECPIEFNQNSSSYTKKDIAPLYAGFTDKYGHFCEDLDLPTYLKSRQVYVFTPSFFAMTLIKAESGDGYISAMDNKMFSGAKVKTRVGSLPVTYQCKAVIEDGWKKWLGEFDESNGYITDFTSGAKIESEDVSGMVFTESFANAASLLKYTTKKAIASNGTLVLDEGGYIEFGNLLSKIPVGLKNVQLKFSFNSKAESSKVNLNITAQNASVSNNFIRLSKSWEDYNFTVSLSNLLVNASVKLAVASPSNYNVSLSDLKVTYTGIETIQGEGTTNTGYAYTTGILKPKNTSDLYMAHTQVININANCPDEYRSATDMYVNEDAEVAITLLGGNTCWNSSLGYYYYKDGQVPSSYNNLKNKVVLIFPNTQDGQYTHPSAKPSDNNTKGVDRGTTVQLLYYPKLAEGSKEGATKIFPKGIRIGFVLACNTWTNRMTVFASTRYDQNYRAATTITASRNNSGNAFSPTGVGTADPRRSAIYRYGDHIIFSFEDQQDDQNYSDVVFTLKSNPLKAITDIPEVDPETLLSTTTVNKGVYCFEDMWPEQGDYDMNDVMVKHTYEKKFSTDKENNNETEIYAEGFIFKTFQNAKAAVYNNGLAFVLNTLGDVVEDSIHYYVKYHDKEEFMEFEPHKKLEKEERYYDETTLGTTFDYRGTYYNVVLLAENVKTHLGAEYKMVINYPNPIRSESSISPFIYRSGNDAYYGPYRWEVHMTNHAPTNQMTKYLWMKVANGYGDASKPREGRYYVRISRRQNNYNGPWYPFAFFLSGANESDIWKLISGENESKMIDAPDMYPLYDHWVESGCTQYTDWYKK